MTKNISFFIETPETASKLKVEACFNNDELYKLDEYLHQTEELRKTRLIQTGYQHSLKINWKKDEGFLVKTQLPPEDDIRSLLYILRPFILKNEFASFEKVTGLLRRKFKNNKEFQKFLKYYRQLYQGKQTESIMKITTSNMVVNSEKTMMDWLNSYEYHRDQNKKEKLKPIFEMFSHDGARAIFVTIIIDKTKAILCIADLIKLALGRDEVNSIYFNTNPDKKVT